MARTPRGMRHLSPNHSVAMPRNEKNPTTSVTVVTNTPDEIAGSARKRWSTSGTRIPPSAPATRLQIMARPITTPRSGTLNHTPAATPVMTAKAKPLTSPTSTSRRTRRAALALDNSCVASARTATVMVWVAALPRWLATIGASTERHHFLQLPLEQAEHRRRQKGRRKVDQQPVEAPACDEPHRV